jgi:hypothetical protein
METIGWPEEVARRVQFLVPADWADGSSFSLHSQPSIAPSTPTSTSSSQNDKETKDLLTKQEIETNGDSSKGTTENRCYLHYNLARRIIEVMSVEDDGRILDTINPDDMVGAQLCLEPLSFEAMLQEPPRCNQSANGTNAIDQSASLSPLFTPSPQLADNKGKTVMTIYTYPQLDKMRKSQTFFKRIWSVCKQYLSDMAILGARQNESTYVPNPQYSPVDHPGPRYSRHLELTLAPCEDFTDAQVLMHAIENLAHSTMSLPASHCTLSTPTYPKHNVNKPTPLPPNMNHSPSMTAMNTTAITDFDEAALISDDEDSPSPLSPPRIPRISHQHSRRYLVLINPASGPKKNALQTWETLVRPMFDQARNFMHYDFYVTTHGHDAYDRMSVRAGKQQSRLLDESEGSIEYDSDDV